MVELMQNEWLLFALAVVVGLLLVWWLYAATRRTRVEIEPADEQAPAAPRRNQALIDAPPAAGRTAGPVVGATAGPSSGDTAGVPATSAASVSPRAAAPVAGRGADGVVGAAAGLGADLSAGRAGEAQRASLRAGSGENAGRSLEPGSGTVAGASPDAVASAGPGPAADPGGIAASVAPAADVLGPGAVAALGVGAPTPATADIASHPAVTPLSPGRGASGAASPSPAPGTHAFDPAGLSPDGTPAVPAPLIPHHPDAHLPPPPQSAPATPPLDPPIPVPLPLSGTAIPATSTDELLRIKGLGPKLAQQLHALGVTGLAQIAAWDEAAIDRIDAQLGRFQGRIRRDDWRGQAQLLTSGDTAAYESRFGKV